MSEQVNSGEDAQAAVIDDAAKLVKQGLDERRPAAADPSPGEPKPSPEKEPVEAKPADAKPADAKPHESDELKVLKERIAQLESSQSTRERRAQAEEFTDTFIRNKCDDAIPPAILRAVLPVTTDESKLAAAKQTVDDHLKNYIRTMVDRGLLAYGPKLQDFGGASNDGGTPPSQAPPANETASDLIRKGLQKARPSHLRQ